MDNKKSACALVSPEKRWRASDGLSPLEIHHRVDKHRWIETLEGLGAAPAITRRKTYTVAYSVKCLGARQLPKFKHFILFSFKKLRRTFVRP